ncbi:5-formyltetrahydrofolate cyclo-ligase [Oceanobacillus caeni]|uniref:5-formyltetrahydrofolate cyclo-ligase n=1 Tax=Oceanobacillus TaxID=182709 RepID=UPI0006223287|nr:5-formyltetrahydrofolate cyclo-ligase [Oceanobacillus caeni]KKE80152.1 5-formyltetrahydrofolate cyclo-ligase [Bacilli bacterium VT-13-104]PZD83477.1 5-formyltetrahydrofolate cyclo-ligase [Bacilli bacterium]MCR1835163.1 5-formyltetrahydrofolate cyclo-ligase [Oceanobacillus caeni]PZD84659.1 5-formyltetrahydrofolate cyclo-ligase [Bacilli bacterium]PZD86953.1 5-formyltetrahydrofolate cyclo-ligase [Bacilli bacterium]
MNKTELRKKTITKLKSLSKDERLEIEQKLRNKLVDSDLWKRAKTIGITISQGFEWDTTPIIKKAWDEGKAVCVPKCLPDKEMVFYIIHDFHLLEKGLYDIPEPNPEKATKVKKQDMDLLIVPGVVFDHNGYRIGFGGGYYDRFLVDFPNETISLASHFQVIEQLPIDSHDLPVTCIVTETNKE